MESVNKSETGNSPRALPVITLEESESNHSRKSSSLSSSSSSSSSSGVVIGLDVDDAIRVDSPEHEEDVRLDSDDINDAFRDNSTPFLEPRSSDSSSTLSPPAQVMERQAEPPASAGYRIPSSVFARTKSTAPMEWSATSNESLFSIQMGNMSFTRDHMNWLGKSGELNYGKSGELNYGGYSNLPNPTNVPRIDMSSNQPPTPSKQPPKPKSAEMEQKSANGVNERCGVAETKAAETMREVIKENEDNHCKEKAHKAPCSSPSLNRSSDASGGSTKSFAFPILTDDKSSRRAKSCANSQPQTPKVQGESHSQKQQSQSPKTENAANNSQSFFECKWLSCFPCCPNCSGRG